MDPAEMDPAEIAPVQALKERTLSTVGDLRKMLGFLSYYRSYIPNFSRIAQPLYQLLTAREKGSSGSEMLVMKENPTRKRKEGNLVSRTPIEWTQTHQATLSNLDRSPRKTANPGFPRFHSILRATLRCIPGRIGCSIVSTPEWEDGSDSLRVQNTERPREKLPHAFW